MSNEKCDQCGVDHKHNDNDPCLGILPGLMNACCGHGDMKMAYVQFLDGQCIRGASAIVIQEELKKHSPEVPSPENFIQGLRDRIKVTTKALRENKKHYEWLESIRGGHGANNKTYIITCEALKDE